MSDKLLAILQFVVPGIITVIFCAQSWRRGLARGRQNGYNEALGELLVGDRVDHQKLAEMLLRHTGNVQKPQITGLHPLTHSSLSSN